jgi:hypothetical protein
LLAKKDYFGKYSFFKPELPVSRSKSNSHQHWWWRIYICFEILLSWAALLGSIIYRNLNRLAAVRYFVRYLHRIQHAGFNLQQLQI